jgi:hypothetical protein
MGRAEGVCAGTGCPTELLFGRAPSGRPSWAMVLGHRGGDDEGSRSPLAGSFRRRRRAVCTDHRSRSVKVSAIAQSSADPIGKALSQECIDLHGGGPLSLTGPAARYFHVVRRDAVALGGRDYLEPRVSGCCPADCRLIFAPPEKIDSCTVSTPLLDVPGGTSNDTTA